VDPLPRVGATAGLLLFTEPGAGCFCMSAASSDEGTADRRDPARARFLPLRRTSRRQRSSTRRRVTPLAKILVELWLHHALELLARRSRGAVVPDQSASIKLLPIPIQLPAKHTPEPHHDDDQYAARLQDAVSQLAQRVGATTGQPTEEFDDRVTDLAERVEATVARTQRIEATLATLAESFEGVTGGRRGGFRCAAVRHGRTRPRPRPDRHQPSTEQTNRSDLRPNRIPRCQPGSTSSAQRCPRHLSNRPGRRSAAIESHIGRARRTRSTVSPRPTRSASSGVTERDRGSIAELGIAPSSTRWRSRDGWGPRSPRRERRHTDEVVALTRVAGGIRAKARCAGRGCRIHAALEEQARSLGELRATVAELESRPLTILSSTSGSPGSETQFRMSGSRRPARRRTESRPLAARLEAGADRARESLDNGVSPKLGEHRNRREMACWRRRQAIQPAGRAAPGATSRSISSPARQDVRQGLARQEDLAGRPAAGSTSSAQSLAAAVL
jgi:hypothetical protein